ncbi:MAG: hypothetical protein D6818_00550 [Bacteroidetes bacterium]|nr:MAG: hypothetical protein D6818_00550 [Bacteroidota bacterium]
MLLDGLLRGLALLAGCLFGRPPFGVGCFRARLSARPFAALRARPCSPLARCRPHGPALILIALLSAAALPAQVTVTARVDSTRMYIGDQQNFYLQLLVSPDTRVEQVDISALNQPPLEVVQEAPWDTTAQGRGLRLDKMLRFTVWDSGRVVIPRVPVVFRQRDQRDTAWSLPIPIEVSLVLPDTSGLAPIKPIIEEPARWTDYLPWLVVAGLVVLLALLLWWWRRRSQPRPAAPAPPPRPPHELALEALERLRKRRLWQQGQVKEYYFELSRILRAYLEARYDILALESTTGEIIAALRQKGVLPEARLAWLHRTLQLADMVKFAKAEPEPSQHVAVMDEVVAFIEETRPFERPPAAANENDDADE